MYIYKDIVTGDEMISDSFKLTVVDDIVFEVEAKMVTVSEGSYDIGGNPSTEGAEEDEGVDTNARTVNNIVEAFRLQPTGYDKKDFTIYIKGYMKKVKEHLEKTKPERVEPFQAAATTFIKKILSKFNEYQFFMGASCDPEAGLAILFYKEDGIIPYFYFFKDGLKEEKL